MRSCSSGCQFAPLPAAAAAAAILPPDDQAPSRIVRHSILDRTIGESAHPSDGRAATKRQLLLQQQQQRRESDEESGGCGREQMINRSAATRDDDLSYDNPLLLSADV